MQNTETHPTFDMIAGFVNKKYDESGVDENEAYLISHFVKCHSCRRIKEDIIAFNDKIENALEMIPSKPQRRLMVKIRISLDKLLTNGLDVEQFIGKEYFLILEGKLSQTIGESVIFLNENIAKLQNRNFDFSYTNAATTRSNGIINKNEIVDESNNSTKVKIEKDSISFSIFDDEGQNHSVLIVPDNMDGEPRISPMEKSGNIWNAVVECPYGQYYFVVF